MKLVDLKLVSFQEPDIKEIGLVKFAQKLVTLEKGEKNGVVENGTTAEKAAFKKSEDAVEFKGVAKPVQPKVINIFTISTISSIPF